SGSRNVGIYLQHGGMVTNAASASIAGGIYGVEIAGGAGVVLNSGSITSSSTTAGGGIVEKAGGSVTNEASGSIAGYYGIKISGAAGTVVNAGTLSQVMGSTTITSYANGPAAILLGDGGSVTNMAGGMIQGRYEGIGIKGAAGAVANSGTILSALVTLGAYSRDTYQYKNATYAVDLWSGGSVTNAASAMLSGDGGVRIQSGVGRVTNTGIINGANYDGVKLAGGYVSNASGGTIHGGYYGVYLSGNATVINSGDIDADRVIHKTVYVGGGGGYGGFGQYGGYQTYTFTVGIGVYVQSGSVTNAAYGSISGARLGVVIGAGTFVNYGTVVGYARARLGSSIVNEASGLIQGSAGAATLTNAGTISGSASVTSRFIDDPGSVVTGGIAGNGSTTLELAGGGFGVLNGPSVSGFGTVQVDSGATWVLTGASTLASGSSLINSGTLALSGATLSDAGGVINNGRIELDPSTMSVASLSGTGTVSLDGGSTLAVQGAVSAGQDIVFTGSGGHLDLATPSDFGGTISGFTNGDIIDLTSVADVAGSSADMDTTTNVLTVTEGDTSYQFQFDKTEHFAGEFFHLASDHNGSGPGTLITENQIACYQRGTLIATGHGEVPVEALAIGDEIMTASGAPRPIKWIGRRSYGGRFILGRKDILPICFKAGSIDDGVPRRDLWISPHHAM
ncbi:MAG TPA: Hint domain-containing protein, partial [Bradyrhizobium sp.]